MGNRDTASPFEENVKVKKFFIINHEFCSWADNMEAKKKERKGKKEWGGRIEKCH